MIRKCLRFFCNKKKKINGLYIFIYIYIFYILYFYISIGILECDDNVVKIHKILQFKYSMTYVFNFNNYKFFIYQTYW